MISNLIILYLDIYLKYLLQYYSKGRCIFIMKRISGTKLRVSLNKKPKPKTKRQLKREEYERRQYIRKQLSILDDMYIKLSQEELDVLFNTKNLIVLERKFHEYKINGLSN